jgi:hypothetical protein
VLLFPLLPSFHVCVYGVCVSRSRRAVRLRPERCSPGDLFSFFHQTFSPFFFFFLHLIVISVSYSYTLYLIACI